MIRPISNSPRTVCFVNDFQVFKGACEKTMKAFGSPVTAAHEAELMIRDDRESLTAGDVALYAIHQRSENKIIKIVNAIGAAKQRSPKNNVITMPVRVPSRGSKLPKAA